MRQTIDAYIKQSERFLENGDESTPVEEALFLFSKFCGKRPVVVYRSRDGRITGQRFKEQH